MRWMAQVGHVARKDTRQLGGFLALYALTAAIPVGAIVTGKAFGPYWTSANSEALGMPDAFAYVLPILLILVGSMFVAALLQLDSPTRPNAFWTTRPLSPGAMLAAKIATTVIVVVGIAIAGTAAGLASVDTSPAMMARLLAPAGLSSGEWALAVLVIGALTTDLRAFAVTMVAIIVGIILTVGAVGDYFPELSASTIVPLTLAGVTAALWFVAIVYRTHERRLGMMIVGMGIVALLLVMSTQTPQAVPPPVPTLNRTTPIQIAPAVSDWTVGSRLPLRLGVAAGAASERLDFKPDSVKIMLPGWMEEDKTGGLYDASVVQSPLPWLGHPVRWLNVDTMALAWPSTLSVSSTWWRVSPTARPGRVTVWGTVTASRSRVLASLPLNRETSVTGDGRIIQVYGREEHDTAEARVWIHETEVARPGTIPEPEAHLRERGGLQFALVNEQRGEAMLIDRPDGQMGNSGLFVIPQISVTTTFNRYTTTTPYSPKGPGGVPRDSSWYAGARLVVVEWSVVGQYRTKGEATVQ